MKPNQNITAITVSNTIAVTANGLWIMFMPLFFSGLGLSVPQVSVIFSCSSLVAAASSPVGGRLADRLGRKPVAVLGRYLTAIGPLSLLVLTLLDLELTLELGLAIAGYLVLSAGSGLRMPAMSMLLMESSKTELRGRNYMIAERVIPSIPPAVSVVVGASLFACGLPTTPFILGFSGLLLSAVILHIVLRETLDVPEYELVGSVSRRSNDFSIGLFFPLIVLAFVLDGTSARAVSWYIPIFLGVENVEVYGILISVTTLGIALFGLVSGMLVDKIGMRSLLIVSWLMLGSTVIIFSQVTVFPLILLTYSIWVALDTVDTAVPPVLISMYYPKEQRATRSGLFRMTVSSALFIGPLLAGLAASFDDTGPFWFKGAMNLLAAFVIAFAFRYQTADIEKKHGE